MLDIKQMSEYAARMFRYFETLIFIEIMHLNRKTPLLDFGPDSMSFQQDIERDVEKEIRGRKVKVKEKIARIHIGLGMFEAESFRELFAMIYYIIGHEMQHFLSTTSKDWEAAQKVCMNKACQKLAKDVLGRPSVRLVNDSDYKRFFEEVRKAGVFVDRSMLQKYIHMTLNAIEDGRIENVRSHSHPGFNAYRRIFRGKLWKDDDLRDAGLSEDVNDLSARESLKTIWTQIWLLATCGIYQKGFLAMYGDTDLYDEVRSYIPLITKAVSARKCKDGLGYATQVFEKLLDRILEACTSEDMQSQMMSLAEDMIQKTCTESEDSSFSAAPSNEEEGTGKMGEGLFGESDLFEEETEESDAGAAGGKGEEESESETQDGEGSGAGDGEESKEEGDGKGRALGESEGESSESDSGGDGGSVPGKGSEPDSGEDGKDDGESDGEGEGDSGAPGEDTTGKHSSAHVKDDGLSVGENRSKGHNNKDLSHEGGYSTEDVEKAIAEAQKAAERLISADLSLAESEAKKEEEMKKAAKSFHPVKPKPVDLDSVNRKYPQGVTLVEKTREYAPTDILAPDLANAGRKLNEKIEELIKNKKEPDLRGQKVGTFDSTRISSLVKGDLSCYKRRGTYVKPDVAGYILIDNSGSMGFGAGSTRNYACDAAAVIEEGFKNHMALKIAAFDAMGSTHVAHEVIKEFDEIAPTNLCFNFRNRGRSGFGNKDGYSIRVASEQLLERPEQDRVLIVLSDGFPSDYPGGYREGCKDVKAAVEEARKEGIKVIGMYMYHDQTFSEDAAIYKSMYEPNYMMTSVENLTHELTTLMKRLFK